VSARVIGSSGSSTLDQAALDMAGTRAAGRCRRRWIERQSHVPIDTASIRSAGNPAAGALFVMRASAVSNADASLVRLTARKQACPGREYKAGSSEKSWCGVASSRTSLAHAACVTRDAYRRTREAASIRLEPACLVFSHGQAIRRNIITFVLDRDLAPSSTTRSTESRRSRSRSPLVSRER